MEAKIEKGFVQKVRQIRDEINAEIIDMNSDQIRAFYKKIMDEVKERRSSAINIPLKK